MKHLDNFLAVFAFGLCTITLATFLGATAGWAYGVLGEYERELIALAGNPLLAGVVTAERAPRASTEADAQVVHLEPLTVIGHRFGLNEEQGRVAHESAPASSNARRGKS